MLDSPWLCANINVHIHSFSTSVVTIGFSRTYSAREDIANITITVLVFMNYLARDRDILVTLSTSDGTAIGELGL